ncbi:MAG TPA: hypothetical protein PK165_02870, partial [bacterium]|nr:hypothetical protein [bacterium]
RHMQIMGEDEWKGFSIYEILRALPYLFVVIIFLLLSSLNHLAFAALIKNNKYYTVQISSLPAGEEEKAVKIADGLSDKGIKEVRIERNQNYLILRAGFFNTR